MFYVDIFYCLREVLNSSCQAFFPLPTLPFSKCSKAISFIKGNMLLGRQEEISKRTFLVSLSPLKVCRARESTISPALSLAEH